MNTVRLKSGVNEVELSTNCRSIEQLMEEAEHEMAFVEHRRGPRSETPAEDAKVPGE